MSNRPSPLGWLTKFVVVPAAVAALGYFVVGPRVGGKVTAPAPLASLRDQWVAKAEPKAKPPEDTAASAVTTSAPPVATSAGPQVDVDVHPAVNRPALDTVAEEPPKPRRKKKRRKTTPPKPVESAPTETAVPATTPTVLEPAPVSTPPPVDPPSDQGGSGGAATAGGTGF
ncbi:MAG: hypothetical protein ACO1SV_09980 [Fimbriimonas sp.]